MATSEFDPIVVKGWKLLFSKSKESTEQLKQLLDEAIAQSKQSNSKDRTYTSVKLEGESKIHIKKAPRELSDTSSFSKYSLDDNRERQSEKRHLDKIKQESIESDAKIPKLEPPQVYSYYPSSPDLPKLDQYVIKKEEDTDSSDDNAADADDFAMEMGLACIICSQIEVTQGNQLIECQECHSLYHQDCHRPPITDYDYNDPRRVWYCAKCVKSMKKMATKTQKTVKSGITVPPKETVSQTKVSKSESSPPSLILPFKRTEIKTQISQGNNQTTANKPIGLAGLAANFGARTTASSSTASTVPTSRGLKTTSAPNLKTLAAFSTSTLSKTSSISTSSTLSKTTSSNAFQNLSLATTAQTSVTSTSQKSSTSSPAKGLSLLSVAGASASNRSTASALSGNGNSTHKVTSCSPLMSADKRLQMMKKKASKQQERRRLSTK